MTRGALRRRYGHARQAGWLTATTRTPANDRAANRAYLKAKKEKEANDKAWAFEARAGRGTGEYAKKLAARADVQADLIEAAQRYARLPKAP